MKKMIILAAVIFAIQVFFIVRLVNQLGQSRLGEKIEYWLGEKK